MISSASARASRQRAMGAKNETLSYLKAGNDAPAADIRWLAEGRNA
jgi:hypothetical protein